MLWLSYSLRNLLARRMTAALTLIGLSLVIFVFTAVLMLAHGLERTLASTGEVDNALILRKGTTLEISSSVYRDQARIILTQPELAVDARGVPLAAGEFVVLMAMRKPGGSVANVMLRGTSPEAIALRPQVRLTQGRWWQPGTDEIVIGTQIVQEFPSARIGTSQRVRKRDWRIVGIFDASRSGFDSEVWGDAEQFLPLFGRTAFTSVIAKVRDAAAFESLRQRLETDRRLLLQVKRERDYYDEKSGRLAAFIRSVGLALTTIFSVGAILGATMTMSGAVASRVGEIGTLRALGFLRSHILFAFLSESVILGCCAGVLGVLTASFLQHITISILNWSTFSELAFEFRLSPAIAGSGFLFAIVMSVCGGVFPAVRAARLVVMDALAARIL